MDKVHCYAVGHSQDEKRDRDVTLRLLYKFPDEVDYEAFGMRQNKGLLNKLSFALLYQYIKEQHETLYPLRGQQADEYVAEMKNHKETSVQVVSASV